MSKHTPGPWTVCEHSWSRTGIYAKHIAVAALDIEDEATEQTQAEWEALMRANAKLIAAAPLMLEALREILAINDEDQGTFRKRGGTRRGLSLVAAKEAISAATGEQP